MRWLIEGSVKARVAVIAIAAAAAFFGAREVREAPVDTLPEFGPTSVEIQAEALGLSAAEVEQLVTVPLEQDLLTFVPWVEVIRSESVPGLARLELIFEPGVDLYRARQMVQERLSEAAVALPGASKVPQMLQPLSSTNRVMIVGLSSEDLSLIDMSVLARWTIKPALLGVEGVSNVAVWGQREQQLQVQVDPARLRQSGATLGEVIETTGNSLWWSPLGFLDASSPGTGGFIDTPNQRLTVQHILPISTPEDLAQVPLEEHPNVRLGDIGDVVEGHQLLIGDAVIESGPSLLLVIEKFPGASTLDVSRSVEEELDALRPGLSGLTMDPTVYHPASSINSGLDDLRLAVIIAIIVSAVAFGAFFFGWRAALVSATVAPLSLLAALFVLDYTGDTFNVVVLAGLVIGAMVIADDAVAHVEQVVRRLRRTRAEGHHVSVASTVVDASVEMRETALLAAAIALLAVVPLCVMDGRAGEFFPPMVRAYGLAVVAAMLVSMTVTPALAALLLSGAPLPEREPPAIRWTEQRFGSLLGAFMRRRFAVYVAVLAVALAAGGAATQIDDVEVLPEFEQRDVLVQWNGAPGTSQPEMSRIISLAATELEAIDGVENVGAHVGRAITGDQVVGANSGEIWVSIREDADYGSTVDAIRGVVDEYPGLTSATGTFPERRVDAVLTESEHDLTVRLYGEDPAVLRTEAEKLRESIAAVDGVQNPALDRPAEEPTIEIEVDLAAAQRFGVNPGDVRRTASTFLSSLFVGALFEEQKVFEVVVWSTPETRESLTSVQNLPIDTPDGGQIRLDDVADIRIEPNPSVIEREAVSRYLDITADVGGRSVGAVEGDIERLVRQAELPLEFHAEVFDAHDGTPGGDDRTLPVAIAAAIGGLLILQFAFNSWRLAALFFVTVPLALAGGVIAASLDGGSLTIGSYAAFLALLAIASRGGIALIRRCQQLREEQPDATLDELVLQATRERVASTIVGAVTIAIGLLPLLLVGDVFGHEVVTPLAIVMLGGLVTSTFFTLFIVPTLYARFAPTPEAESTPSVVEMRPLPAEAGAGGD